MKKSLFFLPLALGLFACTNDEVVNNPDNGENSGDVETSYLSVNIVCSDNGTRATDNQDFAYGTSSENKVRFIRFYFFDEKGAAVSVKANKATYYDAKAEEIEQTNSSTEDKKADENVAAIVKSIIVIESPKGDKKPSYVAAVLNYENAPILEVGETIGKLQSDLTDDKALYEYQYINPSEGNFVMSSSTFMKKQTEYLNIDDIVGKAADSESEYIIVPVRSNIKSTRELAEKEPVVMHVERVLAKVEVGVDIEESINIGTAEQPIEAYKVGNIGVPVDDLSKVEEDDAIFVKFLGWNVTATRKTARLIKKIDADWGANSIFTGWTFSWNDENKFRSYWAVNPTFTTLAKDYNYGNFGEGNKLNEATTTVEKDQYSINYYDFTDKNFTYLQENAGSNKVEDKTTKQNDELSKIIVAAQLVDKNGKSLELVEWGGDVNKKDDDLMNSLAAATDLYIVTNEDGKVKYTQLLGKNIRLIYNNKGIGNDEQNYYVKLELIGDKETQYAIWKYDEAKGWHFDVKESSNDGTVTGWSDKDQAVIDALASVGKIKYWNTGYTYYWVDIKHFGKDTYSGEDVKEEGECKFGVVRNHWYKYTFTSVKGLGVPVADPNEVIYPETPVDEDLYYLAARINVLSWRMVYNNNEGLGW